jgi:RNA polymerase sigma-32 factor
MDTLPTADTTSATARQPHPTVAKTRSQPLLDAEAERDLVARWAAGDRAAGQRLIEAFAPFVRAIAFTYRRSGVPLEDLVQEGSIGLLKAVARFDAQRGTRLGTYAVYWVRAQINEYLSRGNGTVRLGTSKNERRAIRLYRRTREEDPAALALMSGITEKHAAELLPLLRAPELSFDGTPADDGQPLMERVAAAAPSPEESATLAEEHHRLCNVLADVLAQSSPQERTIVEERWLRDEPKTLDELSAELGVSRTRVHQIEERVRTRMRGRLTRIVSSPVLM